jgi:hypothetical protein
MEATKRADPTWIGLPIASPYANRPISREDQTKREAWLQAWKNLPAISIPAADAKDQSK